MYNICIFAGTTEGRKLAEFLQRQSIRVTVCAATEYGGEMIPASDRITVLSGRKSTEDMIALFQKESFDLVIDATHPYAESVTESISEACSICGILYHRLLRTDSGYAGDAVYVENAQAAAKYLNLTEGNILLTTGSKELHIYASIAGFSDRVFARVLPMESSLDACRKAGLSPSHIIAMQGPFTEELNCSMLQFVSAWWMVTKEGGDTGGFAEKVRAAEKTGAGLIVIGKPPQKKGVSYGETIQMLCRQYGCVRNPEIVIAGIGPGNEYAMTREVHDAIEQADCLIGARRMLEGRTRPGQAFFEAVKPEEILEYIQMHPEYQSFTIIMSGDTGFFSGTRKLFPMLAEYSVRLLPGLSSLTCLLRQTGNNL